MSADARRSRCAPTTGAWVEAFYQHAELAYLLKDDQLRYVYVSPRAADLLDRPASECIGATDFELLTRADCEACARVDRAVLDQGLTDTGLEYWGGQERLVSRMRFAGPDGRYGLAVLIHDSREAAPVQQHLLELQLLRTQREQGLGVLAGRIAHDFNNILLTTMGYAELSLRECSPVSPVRHNLEEILAACRSAADLCGQLLAYAGWGAMVRSRINLATLIDDTAHLLHAAIHPKAMLHLHMDRDIPIVNADPSLIRQALLSLVTNASEALEGQTGTISVSVSWSHAEAEYLRTSLPGEPRPAGAYVHVSVSDTGCGIPADVLQHVCDPFFTTRRDARGLGLAAALGIVRTHGGVMRIYSEPGRGTTVKMLFPVDGQSVSDAPAELAGEPKAAVARTVLLADDDPMVRRVSTRMLESLGCSVIAVADGREAVETFEQHAGVIDLVLLDLTMPRMTGAEAFSAIRRLNPHVPVMLASGYAEEAITGQFCGKGLTGFLQKPFLLDDLRRALELV